MKAINGTLGFNLSKTDIAFDNPLYKELLEYIKVELNFRNCRSKGLSYDVVVWYLKRSIFRHSVRVKVLDRIFVDSSAYRFGWVLQRLHRQYYLPLSMTSFPWRQIQLLLCDTRAAQIEGVESVSIDIWLDGVAWSNSNVAIVGATVRSNIWDWESCESWVISSSSTRWFQNSPDTLCKMNLAKLTIVGQMTNQSHVRIC